MLGAFSRMMDDDDDDALLSVDEDELSVELTDADAGEMDGVRLSFSAVESLRGLRLYGDSAWNFFNARTLLWP